MSDDWIKEQYDRNRRTQATASVRAASSSKPDAAARANALSRRLGIPADVIERNIADVDARDAAARRARLLEQAPPATQQWFADPRNAAAAQDDVEQLARMGTNLALFANQMAINRYNQEAYRPPVKAQKRSSTFLEGLAKIPGRIGTGGAGLNVMAVSALNTLEEFGEAIDTPFAIARDAVVTVHGGKPQMESLRRRAEKNRAERLAYFQRGVEQSRERNRGDNYITEGLLGGLESVPLTIGALLTRNPTAASAVVGGGVGAQAYQEGRQEGMDMPAALRYSLVQGGAEAVFERLPMASLLDLKGRGFLKYATDYLQAELPGELATTTVQSLSDWVQRNPDATYAEWAAGLPDEYAQTVLGVIGGGSVTVGAQFGVEKVIQRVQRQERQALEQASIARIGGALLDGIMNDAGATKLRETDPEGFLSYVAQLAQNTPVENVYIPAEAIRELFQDDWRDNPFFSQYEGQIEEALALDGDVVIPLADVATGLAGAPEWNVLREEARFSPGGMSQAELRSLEESYQQDREIREARVAEQVESATASAEPFNQVYGEFKQKFMDAGYTPDVADRYAVIVAANRETWGNALGMTAAEYSAANPINIRRVLPERLALATSSVDGLDLVINAMQKGVDPARGGKSLLEWASKRGGFIDDRGDIRAMGGDGWHKEKPFRKRLLREIAEADMLGETGGRENTVEAMFEAAISEGYFPELAGRIDQAGEADIAAEKPDLNVFLGAIGRELSGSPVYPVSAQQVDETNRLREAADELRQLLNEAGLDPDRATKKEINQALDQRRAEIVNGRRITEQRDGRGGDQGGKYSPLDGSTRVGGTQFGPIPELVDVAERYAQENGIAFRRQGEWAKIDEAFSKRLADAYEAMEHAPEDPKVLEAYEEMIRQTVAQYAYLVKAGFEFTFYDENSDPYGGNPWNAMRDLRDNKRMAVFSTRPLSETAGQSYGSNATDLDVSDNPMLRTTGIMWRDQDGIEHPVLANDLFRAVHDAFGHGLEGAGFRAEGEENAWQAHVRLFTGSAVGAITSETRGQNSWLNFGPYGEANRTALVEDTVFADQKTGLMPEWTWTEGRAPDKEGADGRQLEQLAEGLVEGEVAVASATGSVAVGWTGERIKALLGTYGYNPAFTGNDEDATRTKAYATRLSPDQFLGLTASPLGRKLIAERVEGEGYGGEIDFDRMRGETVPPFLIVKPEGGFTTALGNDVPLSLRVMGHEGRHRMTMLKKAGVESVPVVIIMQEKGMKPPASGQFGPQRSRSDQVATGDAVAEFDGLEPISYANRERLMAEFGQGRVLFQDGAQALDAADPRILYQSERFFSALERAVEGVSAKRAPAAQWLATLKKAPGVKAEELEWTGLEEWLTDQTAPVEKDEVLRVLRAGAITVEERLLGEPDESRSEEARQERVEELENEFFESGQFYNWYEPYYTADEIELDEIEAEERGVEPGTYWVIREGGRDVGDEPLFDDEDDARERAEELDQDNRSEAEMEAMRSYVEDQMSGWDDEQETDAEYSGYSLASGDPVGMGYRELLIHFPWKAQDNRDGDFKNLDQRARDLHNNAPTTHWSAERGVVAHARFHDRKGPNGEKILFLDEIQSDWHQQGRDQGYDKPADPETQEKARKAFEEAGVALDTARTKLGTVLAELRPLMLEWVEKALDADLARSRAEIDRQYAKKVADAEEGQSLPPVDDRDAQEENLRSVYGEQMYRISVLKGEGYYGKLFDIPARTLKKTAEAEGWVLPERLDTLRAEYDLSYDELSSADDLVRLRERELEIAEKGGGIPDAPFKNTWPMLAMKSVIVHAAEGGYDQIAWIKQGENNGGMNDNVGWFYEKVLPNETGKLVKKYGSKVRPLKVKGLRPVEQPRVIEINERMGILNRSVAGVASKVGSIESLFEQVREARERLAARLEGERQQIAVRQHEINVERARLADGIPGKELAFDPDNEQRHVDAALLRLGNEQKTVDDTADWPTVEAAILEHRALDAEKRELEANAPTNLGFDITEEMRKTALEEGFPLFQSNRDNGPLGATSGGIISGTDEPTLIEVFEKGNLSTVLHELSHVFAEEMKRNAALPEAPQWLKDDWRAVEAWFAENGHPMQGDYIPTEAHEMFARTGERYFMEGKAPVPALQRAFDSFRGWLLKIYQHVVNLRSPITPDIRRVFDRMLATQDAIDAAADRQQVEARFENAAQAGMTEAEFEAYRQLADSARSEAFDALLYRTMESIRKERTKTWKDRQAAIRADVEKSVDARPMFRALHLLRTGRFLGDPEREPVTVKLDRAWIVDRYGEDAVALLPRNVPPIYKEQGDNPDAIANLVGFRSGDEMVRALMGMERQKLAMREAGDKRSLREATIADETQAIMEERYGNPLDDGSIEEEALAAIHNDKQGELIASENRQLAKQSRQQPTPYSMARQWAARKIAEGKVVDVASRAAIQRYARAQAKAAKAFEAALVEGDVEEAFRQSEIRLVNHALIAEAKKAADRVDVIVPRLAKVAKARQRKSVDQDYWEQARALLEKFEFAPRSQRALDEIEAFSDWAERQRANGHDVLVPPRLEGNGVNYSRMSFEELVALDEIVGQILHLGRLKKTLRDGQEQREFDALVDEADAQGDEFGRKPPEGSFADPTWWDSLKGKALSLDAALLKIEQVIDWLDNGNPDGVFNRIVFRPVAEAQEQERQMVDEYHGLIRAAFERVPAKTAKTWADVVTLDLIDVETGLPAAMTRQKLIAMALNWGNAGNRQRLADGYRWSERGIERALVENLTEAEWGFVQEVWDVIEGLWPMIEAMERRVNGIAPEKVERLPFQVTVGEGEGAVTVNLKGGYYPAIYDTTLDYTAEQRAAEKSDLFGANYLRATTRSSATKERSEKVKRPILLDLGVINRHVGEVIHDLTHREPVMNAHKFLTSPRVMKMMDQTVGREARQQFVPWLNYVANSWAHDRAGHEGWGKFFGKLRANATVVGMGFRVSTIMLQVTGFSNAAEFVGAKWIADAAARASAHPNETFQFVMSRSKEVPGRLTTLDRDIRVELERMAASPLGKGLGKIQDIQRFAFHGIGYMDRVVTIPTWLGAYNRGLSEGMSEDGAAYFADKAIRLSQGAGGAKDLAAIARGTGRWGEALKLMTMFYSYLSAVYSRQRNLARDARRAKVKDLPRLMARAWWLVVLPPLMAELLAGRGPEEEEEWGWWAFRHMLRQSLGAIPGVRDLVDPLWNEFTGQWGFDYRFTPAQGVVESMIRVAGDLRRVSEGEETKRMTRNVLELTGYATGIPPGQIAATTQFLVDVGSGDADPETVGDWWTGLTKGRLEE